MQTTKLISLLKTTAFVSAACCFLTLTATSAAADETKPQVHPRGQAKTVKSKALEAGTVLLQGDQPLDAMNIYLVGFQSLKDSPNHQVEVHNFCRKANEEFTQCAIFDGNGKDANLIGIKYIISDRLYNSLPADEKANWHSVNYEITSGQLVAPNVPNAAEKALMRKFLNGYSKAWILWNSGNLLEKGNTLPIGEAQLGWAPEAQLSEPLLLDRDKRFNIDTNKIRDSRKELNDHVK